MNEFEVFSSFPLTSSQSQSAVSSAATESLARFLWLDVVETRWEGDECARKAASDRRSSLFFLAIPVIGWESRLGPGSSPAMNGSVSWVLSKICQNKLWDLNFLLRWVVQDLSIKMLWVEPSNLLRFEWPYNSVIVGEVVAKIEKQNKLFWSYREGSVSATQT